MGYKIALLGNPNCGKTTMYNALTGSTQYVGNWPGVTVEKKEGELKKSKNTLLVDLPGIYSLSPYSLEERVTRDYLTDDKPNAIINIVDSTNIERSLYLTTQLLEMNIPMVVALNMSDILEKRNDTLDEQILSKKLGCPVIKTSASEGFGLDTLMSAAMEQVTTGTAELKQIEFECTVCKAIKEIETIVEPFIKGHSLRWVAVNLFGRDPVVKEHLSIDNDAMLKIDTVITKVENEMGDDAESILANGRYFAIDKILSTALCRNCKSGEAVSDQIDRVVTNRFLGLPIFFAIMWGVYYVSISTVGDFFIGWIEESSGSITAFLETFLTGAGVSEWLISLINDGCIGGVTSVLTFVPQLMILYVFIAILEDSGYMARVAFIMDRIFRSFGLSGKSFIPMLIGSGCAVPAIMGSRTIENDKDRRMTIILTPFIPCGAKLPVLALFTAMFFQNNTWVGPSMYIIGIVMVIISGIILKKTKMFAGDPAPFVMELPGYRIPTIKGVLIHTWDRGKAFMIKAGTIIFFACGVIWFLQSFNISLEMVDMNESMLASFGKIIAPIFAPLGFGSWQAAVAVVTGFLAKEVVVATLGILYGLGEVSEGDPNLIHNLAQVFTPISAYSFMVFTVLAPPCFAAIGAIRAEMKSIKWTLFALGWQLLCGYVVATLIYQIGSRIL
ncbi:MAG: ferrous iron transport protein B [Synergistaceae bacterium]